MVFHFFQFFFFSSLLFFSPRGKEAAASIDAIEAANVNYVKATYVPERGGHESASGRARE